MRKTFIILLALLISLNVGAQKKDSSAKAMAPEQVIMTDSTEFISLNAVRHLFENCKKELTYNECEKLNAILDKWLTEIADSYRLKEAAKRK